MASGLPIEAQVGIAVGVSACALTIGALASLALRNLKHRRAKRSNNYIGMPPAQYPGFQFQRGYTEASGRSPYSPSSLNTKTSETKSDTSRTTHVETLHTRAPQELPAVEPAAAELPS
ncbi:hypothetical protein F5Y06DRAFT_270413 [Hypoxylon sp. FL0890]|nr:hypothetical protein F5Y06DRAFT_270413 [Hypoxylon sp. FL0890]